MRSKLQLDAKDFASGLDSASGKLSGFRRLMASASATAAGFLGASVIQRGIEGVKNQIGGIISAGSDMNETVSKTQVVFGDSFDAINKWASGSAKAFGLSKQQALDTVSTYGAMAKAAGQSGGEAVKFGEDLVGAASDLGSFWNFDPSQVAADIQSGLAGESEPLRKYNIFLNETAVNAKAAEMGLVGSNGVLTDENKILARKALIMEQLGPAAGDYARTQKGLANGTRTLTAYFKNFQAWLGGKIVPTVAKGVAWINKLAGRFQRLREDGLSPTQALLKTLRIELYQVFGRGVLDAITSVARAFVAVWGAVKLWGGSLIDAFRSGSKVSDLVEKFPKPLQGMAKGFLTIADAVGDAFAAFRSGNFLEQLPDILGQVFDGLKTIGAELVGAAVDLAEWTINVGIPKLGGWITSIGGSLWDWIKGQLGIGATATGDGTGGPDTDRQVSLGSWLIDVAAPNLLKWTEDFSGWLWEQIKSGWDLTIQGGMFFLNAAIGLLGDLASLRDDFETWIKSAINWTGDKTVAVGKLLINTDAEVHDNSGDDEAPGKTFAQKVIDGIKTSLQALADAGRWVVEQIAIGAGDLTGHVAGLIVLAAGGFVLALVTAIKSPMQVAGVETAINDLIVQAISGAENWTWDTVGIATGAFWTHFKDSFAETMPDDLISGITTPIQDAIDAAEIALDLTSWKLNVDIPAIGDFPSLADFTDLVLLTLLGIGDLVEDWQNDFTLSFGLPGLGDFPSWNDIYNLVWNGLRALGGLSIGWPNSWSIDFPSPSINVPFVGSHAAGGVVKTPLQWVGERGPELVSLPMGSRVFSAAESLSMIGSPTRGTVSTGSTGGGGTVVNHYYVIEPGSYVGPSALSEIEKHVASGQAKRIDRTISSRGLGESY